MAKPAVAPTKRPKKPRGVDRDTILLRELEKTKKTISDASILVSKDLALVMATQGS